jgi:NADPH-ferrihemoprotein reductase
MFPYGEGDDDATLEDDFDAWRAQLWPALTAKFHPDASSDRAGAQASSRARLGSIDEVHKVKLLFNAVDAPSSSYSSSSSSSSDHAKIAASTKHFFTAPRAAVLVNRELRNVSTPAYPGKGKGKKPAASSASTSGSKTPDADLGSTRHVEIDLKSVGLSYLTADNLAILPENSPAEVEALAASQGYDLDYSFTVVPTAEEEGDFKQSFPTPCTVREALTLYLDIHGSVHKALLKHLAAYVTDAKQTAWLQELLSKDNKAGLKRLSEEEGTTLVDLLTNELSSCKIPLSDLLHIVPFIQPRYYTISSSSSCFPDTVHITVSITEYALKSGKQFSGLTSAYLKTLVPGQGDSSKCRVFIRASSFRLPASLSTPILMVGPGTGLAPMRALLQERKFQQEKSKAKAGSVQNVLFFGCKNREVDYIYRDELEAYEQEGVLTKLHTAFSRDGPKKVYVQNLMVESNTAADLLDLLTNQGAYVYVCGATAMGTDVMAAFVKILEDKNGMSAAQATAFMKELHEKGRYVQELWTA